ncbi:MAG: YggS family pyridoxal phosphate-dependent enzyme [Planctomycetes bacterium]|nr:YggS family pyridoxal phosphate-dependent enzyme [Planctomycetota bacterium]
MATLASNLAAVQQRIANAAKRAGRKPEDITLIAVTKTVDAATVQALIELGVTDIGENRLQDAVARFKDVAGIKKVRRHFIGHLQSNKVKGVLEHFSCIHSLDSFQLAQEINKRAAAVDCFIEINSGETQKEGIAPRELPKLLEMLGKLPRVRPIGLMTMAPASKNPGDSRPHFIKLAGLAKQMRDDGLAARNFDQLSMGMSGDFEVAIECGATHVRVGTALFEDIA